MAERILRLPDVKKLSGISRSSIYKFIAEGFFSKPIALGPRMVGWLESELAALNAARVRGASEDEIREIVQRLEAARKNAA
jgi:prophage regulatory protein